MSFAIATATLAHAAELAQSMRTEDEAECLASGHATAREALEAGIANSDAAWAVSFGGELGAIVGVDVFEEAAYIWCLTGRVVERAKLSFWRASLTIVELCRRRYGPLFCLADSRYVRARAWLDRLGFVYVRPVVWSEGGPWFDLMTIGGL